MATKSARDDNDVPGLILSNSVAESNTPVPATGNPDTGAQYTELVDANGDPVNINFPDDIATETKQDDIIAAIENIPATDVSGIYSKPTDAYALSNIDDSTSTEYYGYEDADGAWYIKKLDSNAFTFVSGASNYSTAWTNRASQSYASYASTF